MEATLEPNTLSTGGNAATSRLKTSPCGSLQPELQSILKGDEGLKCCRSHFHAQPPMLSHAPSSQNNAAVKPPPRYLSPSVLGAFPTWTPESCCCSSRSFHRQFCTLSTRRRRLRPARGRRRWPPVGGSWARWGEPCPAALLAQGTRNKEQGTVSDQPGPEDSTEHNTDLTHKYSTRRNELKDCFQS